MTAMKFKGPANPLKFIEETPHDRPLPDFCAESQTTMNRIGAVISYFFLISAAVYGMFIGKIKGYKEPLAETKRKGYAPMLQGFGSLFQRTFFAVVNDCWSRPVKSAPGVWVDVGDRERSHKGWNLDLEFNNSPNSTRCANLGSYNYLGFARSADGDSEEQMRLSNETINNEVIDSCKNYGVAMGSPAHEVGQTDLHKQLENEIASFVGKQDALIFGMGYATNSTNIPLLAGPGTLIISDSLNHASLVVGCRGSGATLEIFRHNDLESLEDLLVKNIRKGQDKPGKPYISWKKIIIIVEGIYSMEGEILRLPEIIALKKKYKAYLYIDEAHSIGSLGQRGRGVCDYWGVDPSEVDVLMGTFTKSFSSVGGYIAGDSNVIHSLRVSSVGMVYSVAMPVPTVRQALSALRVIHTDGALRIRRLKENSIYFRRRLKDNGFIVAGDYDSPVIPVMCYAPLRFCAMSRDLLKRNVAIVVVGYPATPVLLGRARFCMSSAHTIEQLEKCIQDIIELGKAYHIDYYNNNFIDFLKSL
eukprot:TRINITY_DN2580_c0_g1_i2.p1 TRINITY_DN2580_c0_g1~~TRINITY_DN2580_c0_g1_i2.p1  ORF type:complete len:530 (+),score=138.74 TRINITY_DN2580_c0_g1_i2:131-1720(+)